MDALRKMDVLVESIGNPGKFQVIAYFCLVTNMILVMSNHLAMVFFAAETKHHCKLADGEHVEYRVPVVITNNEKQWDGCRLYTGNTTETAPCSNGWKYYLEDREATIISEFDLVCDESYKADLATTIYFGGVTLGSLVLGFPADKYGRKPVIACLQFASGALAVGIFFSRGYVAFAVLRFFLGFAVQGILNIGFVLALELFQTKYRARAGIFFAVGSVTGGIVCGISSYLIRNWRYTQLALSTLSFIQLMLLCFCPESLRWLILQRKFKRAEAVVWRVVSYNKLPFPRQLFDEVKERYTLGHCETTQQNAGFTDLFRSRTLRYRTFILITVWFTVSAAFYGLAFNISALFGNKYINFGISEAVDLCAVIFMVWAVPRFGRRRPLGIAFFLCGMANIVCLVTKVVKSDSRSLKLVGTAMALFGKACVVACLTLVLMFTSELYPTVLRNIGVGLNSCCSRIGGMAAPQMFLLGRYTSAAVPYALLGAFSLVTSFLVFLLPETHNRALVDTLEHTEEFENKVVNANMDENVAFLVDQNHKFYHETSL